MRTDCAVLYWPAGGENVGVAVVPDDEEELLPFAPELPPQPPQPKSVPANKPNVNNRAPFMPFSLRAHLGGRSLNCSSAPFFRLDVIARRKLN